MKKLTALLLMVVLIFSFAACGGQTGNGGENGEGADKEPVSFDALLIDSVDDEFVAGIMENLPTSMTVDCEDSGKYLDAEVEGDAIKEVAEAFSQIQFGGETEQGEYYPCYGIELEWEDDIHFTSFYFSDNTVGLKSGDEFKYYQVANTDAFIAKVEELIGW